ncbi:MAG: hypothetical protein Q9195_007317 [Heterodermia aff. obscurata]
MPFMGDSRRRHLRRLSTKSTASSTKTDGSHSDSTPSTPKTSKSLKHGGAKPAPARAIPMPPRSIPQSPRKAPVNVFAFMEEDEQGIDTPRKEHIAEEVPDLSSSPETSSSTSSHPHLQSPYSDLEVHGSQNRMEYLWCDSPHKRGYSIHSDSGVSMLSSSPADESPVLGYKARFPAFKESAPTAPHQVVMDNTTSTLAPEVSAPQTNLASSTDVQYMEEPEAYYVPLPAVPTHVSKFHPPQGLQPTLSPSPYGSSSGNIRTQRSPVPEVKKSGYDLLASSIGFRDDTLLAPIYRKFETLNNRILLYLQDEISEMEESLRELDAAITQEEGHRTASRRSDPMYPSQLKWQRQDLMCRIFSKVEQYSKSPDMRKVRGVINQMTDLALSSYSNLAKCLEPASQPDIDAYRSWIAKHAPLVEQETDFLLNKSDLTSVSRSNIQMLRQPDATPVIVVAVVLVSMIVVFKVVPQILARLVISAVVGLGGLCTLAPSMWDDVTRIKEWKYAVGL